MKGKAIFVDLYSPYGDLVGTTSHYEPDFAQVPAMIEMLYQKSIGHKVIAEKDGEEVTLDSYQDLLDFIYG